MFGAGTGDDLPENGGHDSEVCMVVGRRVGRGFKFAVVAMDESPITHVIES